VEKRVDMDDVNNVEAFIIDMSTWGTFVNDELVGQNKCRPLINGDSIAVRRGSPIFE
jgi:hypothetical protein